MKENINIDQQLVKLLSEKFLPILFKFEDFDKFIKYVHRKFDKYKQQTVAYCIERFDDEIRSQIPVDWKIVKRIPRTVTCIFGKITFKRTLFKDNFGRTRYLCDELLGISSRKRFSDDVYTWLLSHVARCSFGQVAKDFKEVSGAYISKMTIWNMVQEQALLIQKYYQTPYGDSITTESICVESDGIFVAFQSPERRKKAISRLIYRQEHSKKSFEIKVAATYAGKVAEACNRKRRVNLNLYATIGSGEELMNGINNQINNEYDSEYLKYIYYGTDGGSWCKNHKLHEVNNNIKINQSLDGFHIMQAIWKVFPKGKVQDWLVYLILRRRPEKFINNLQRIIERLHGKTRKKAKSLLRYVENNVELIKANFNLGTMEGTNAHVWAKRMKHIGGAWSKHGANSMAILLAHLHSGKAILAQNKNIFFSETDKDKKDKALQKITNKILQKFAETYEPSGGSIHCQRVKDLVLPPTLKYPN